jgi:transposase
LARESDRPLAHITRDLGMHQEALRTWVRQDEADPGERTDHLSIAEREELVRLRAENRDLRANEILREASVPSIGSTGDSYDNAMERRSAGPSRLSWSTGSGPRPRSRSTSGSRGTQRPHRPGRCAAGRVRDGLPRRAPSPLRTVRDERHHARACAAAGRYRDGHLPGLPAPVTPPIGRPTAARPLPPPPPAPRRRGHRATRPAPRRLHRLRMPRLRRLLGSQRCPDCATFTRRVGIGGPCPPLRRTRRAHRAARLDNRFPVGNQTPKEPIARAVRRCGAAGWDAPGHARDALVLAEA